MSSTQVDNLDPLELERGDDEECLATFWRQATPGTSYYRCLLPARYLPGQAVGLVPTDVQEIDGEEFAVEMPRQRGTAVWQFLGDDSRARIAAAMQGIGIRTLMEVDDNYIVGAPKVNARYSGTWRKTPEEAERDGTMYSYEQHRYLVPMFDGIICTTENLAETYREYNDNVYVCPNQIDPQDWEFERDDHDTLRIVFSGSTSHWPDIPIITKAMKWAARQPGVEVYYQGLQPRGSRIGKPVPWVESLEAYRKSLFQFDVGLCPIKPHPWANGKSDLKALEFAMAGVMPVLGEAVPYEGWFDRWPEFVVPFNEQAWLDKVKWIVKNRDMVKDIAATWKEIVLRERTIEGNIGLWREAINGE